MQNMYTCIVFLAVLMLAASCTRKEAEKRESSANRPATLFARDPDFSSVYFSLKGPPAQQRKAGRIIDTHCFDWEVYIIGLAPSQYSTIPQPEYPGRYLIAPDPTNTEGIVMCLGADLKPREIVSGLPAGQKLRVKGRILIDRGDGSIEFLVHEIVLPDAPQT